MRDAWERVTTVLAKMIERLNEYTPSAGKGDRAKGIFRDSLVENVRELIAVLPSFNLTGDSFLATLADRMERELCAHEAEELREL